MKCPKARAKAKVKKPDVRAESKSKREKVVLSKWPRKGREILVVAKRASSQTTQTRVTTTLP